MPGGSPDSCNERLSKDAVDAQRSASRASLREPVGILPHETRQAERTNLKSLAFDKFTQK